MISQIFKTGGGAGIGSYVLVIKDGVLLNPKAEKIRWAYDSGENLFLSIIDDTTEEALLPLTGYVDNDGVLHLAGRDFDDDKTYIIEIDGKTHSINTEMVDGITLGEGTIGTGSIDIPTYTIDGEKPSQDILKQIYNDRPVMFKLVLSGGGSYDPGSYDPGSYEQASEFFFVYGCESKGTYKTKKEDKEYSILSYYSINPFAEIERGSYDPSIDADYPEGVSIFIGKVDGIDRYLFNSDSFSLGFDEKDVDNIIYNFFYNVIVPYIEKHGGGDPKTQQMATAIIRNPNTNLNGRELTNYQYTLTTVGGYKAYVISYHWGWVGREQAEDYMEYMCGSRYVPEFNYEKPQNDIWIMIDGSVWKPQWSPVDGMVLFALPSPYLNKMEVDATLDLNKGYVYMSQYQMEKIMKGEPASVLINGYLQMFLQSVAAGSEITYTGFLVDDKTAARLLTFIIRYDYVYNQYTISSQVENLGGDLNYATNEQIDEIFATYYNIYYNLYGEGVTFVNDQTQVRENNGYYSEVHVDRPFYALDSLYVFMGGQDITNTEIGSNDYVWNGSRFLVPVVTGELVFEATSHRDENVVNVHSILENCYIVDGDVPQYVYKGESIRAHFTYDESFIGLTANVKVGGEDVTSTCWDPDTNYLDIENIQGDVFIQINAVSPQTVKVTIDVPGHISLDNYDNETQLYAPYSNTMKAVDHFEYSISMNGLVVQSGVSSWNDSEFCEIAQVNIDGVTGDIELWARLK